MLQLGLVGALDALLSFVQGSQAVLITHFTDRESRVSSLLKVTHLANGTCSWDFIWEDLWGEGKNGTFLGLQLSWILLSSFVK